MIKIIKQPRRNRITCSQCYAELEYGKEDTRRKQTGMQEWDYFLTCPCCGKELMIP